MAETKVAGGGEERWFRDRGAKGIGGDLWSCLPAELRSWIELLPPARGGGPSGRLQGVVMHTKHCSRKASLAAVQDE